MEFRIHLRRHGNCEAPEVFGRRRRRHADGEYGPDDRGDLLGLRGISGSGRAATAVEPDRRPHRLMEGNEGRHARAALTLTRAPP